MNLLSSKNTEHGHNLQTYFKKSDEQRGQGRYYAVANEEGDLDLAKSVWEDG